MSQVRRRRRRWGILALAVAAVMVAAWIWRRQVENDQPGPLGQQLQAQLETDVRDVEPEMASRIESFCSDCHRLPRPDRFPRYAWHNEVRMGYSFYAKSGRTDLDPPPVAQTVRYYLARAPVKLRFPQPQDATTSLACTFRVQRIQLKRTDDIPPAVAHLRWLELTPDQPSYLVVSDMRRGTLLATRPDAPRADQPIRLASLDHPCHFEPCDLDADGRRDLLVADLGSFPPGDHDRGRVVWLRRLAGELKFETRVLASGLGRVSDVRPLDVDRDGDLDLLVGVFGMDKTGGIRLLRNTAAMGEAPEYVSEVLDPRPGVVHLPVCDISGDGYPDFVALTSQEYEQVNVFVNLLGTPTSEAAYLPQLVWQGPDLTFGGSGLEVVDLDQDGDRDLLLTNGDAFDNGFVNPGHGVQWLENLGQLKFTCHRLADLLGAYVAKAGDVDLDGDLDIVAAAWLPGDIEPEEATRAPLASLICLEQTTPNTFVRHTLERDMSIHATLELVDLDDDGDLDFVVGSHTISRAGNAPHWVAVWRNQLHTAAADGPRPGRTGPPSAND